MFREQRPYDHSLTVHSTGVLRGRLIADLKANCFGPLPANGEKQNTEHQISHGFESSFIYSFLSSQAAIIHKITIENYVQLLPQREPLETIIIKNIIH